MGFLADFMSSPYKLYETFFGRQFSLRPSPVDPAPPEEPPPPTVDDFEPIVVPTQTSGRTRRANEQQVLDAFDIEIKSLLELSARRVPPFAEMVINIRITVISAADFERVVNTNTARLGPGNSIGIVLDLPQGFPVEGLSTGLPQPTSFALTSSEIRRLANRSSGRIRSQVNQMEVSLILRGGSFQRVR